MKFARGFFLIRNPRVLSQEATGKCDLEMKAFFWMCVVCGKIFETSSCFFWIFSFHFFVSRVSLFLWIARRLAGYLYIHSAFWHHHKDLIFHIPNRQWTTQVNLLLVIEFRLAACSARISTLVAVAVKSFRLWYHGPWTHEQVRALSTRQTRQRQVLETWGWFDVRACGFL